VIGDDNFPTHKSLLLAQDVDYLSIFREVKAAIYQISYRNANQKVGVKHYDGRAYFAYFLVFRRDSKIPRGVWLRGKLPGLCGMIISFSSSRSS
jgi:hypothetical protein